MSRPEMMAIGDSLFNGVRSLTMRPEFAQWSPPAQVARALNIPFAVPDYPRNVVINFEEWLRQIPNVFAIVDDVERNIQFWDGRPLSRAAQFDNIAIASTSYADMSRRSWETAQGEIDDLRGSLGEDFTKVTPHLAELFRAFNTRFVLNPMGDMTAPALSPLDLVARRQPKRLLVNIGGNNGLWEMTFASQAASGAGQPSGPYNATDLRDLRDFIGQLKALPDSIEHIYLNALALPSCSANMTPRPDTVDTARPAPGEYYPLYENRFGFNYGVLTAEQMCLNDQTVRDVNALAAAEAAADPRIHIVATDALFEEYDFKGRADGKVVRTADGMILSNLMLEGPSLLNPVLWRGGLVSLDGMHPTTVGYALIARQILATIFQHEDLEATTAPDFERAYQVDSLLQHVPGAWETVLDLSLEIRRLSNGPATSPRHQTLNSLLDAVQFKID
jgi:lysophospholipase L1-like esterase